MLALIIISPLFRPEPAPPPPRGGSAGAERSRAEADLWVGGMDKPADLWAVPAGQHEQHPQQAQTSQPAGKDEQWTE